MDENASLIMSDSLMMGDVVLFYDRAGFLPAAIRWATRRKGESPTLFHHVGVMSNYLFLVEAKTKVEKNRFPDDRDFEVYRHKGLTLYERASVAYEAVIRVGTRYAYPKLLTNLADGLISKMLPFDVFLFRKLLDDWDLPICSTLVANAYYKGADYLFFDVDPNCATPDDIGDHVKANSKEWLRIR